MGQIRIGIFGYGNLGRGVECSVRQNPDLRLTAVFTRRPPEQVHILTKDVPVYPAQEAKDHKEEVDVLILCGGSATDLPEQTPELVQYFHVLDSFDNHADIPKHFSDVDIPARASEHTALISAGWDPGLFSLNRLMAESLLPHGATYTFWGKGVSQGHSDAIRRIDGVKDARQYTIPVSESLDAVRSGKQPQLTVRDKHIRECFVVINDGADQGRIEQEIKTMPHYFDEYETVVHFVSEETLRRDHSGIPHGGFVIRSGKTGWDKENNHVMECSLKLDSNPEFTSSVLVAYARAVHRLARNKDYGCHTVFDIAPGLLSPKAPEELRRELL